MFSIIIPTLNNLEYLRLCIKSLRNNSSYSHQIIPHVNIGEDGTVDFLEKENMEIKNLNLGDYIRVYDSVIAERVLENFLEICKNQKYIPGGVQGENTKNSVVDKNIRKVNLWNLSNMDKSLTTVHWHNFLRYFFTLKHEEYMSNFKNDIIPYYMPR